MTPDRPFPHLRLLRTYHGSAKLPHGGKPDPQTEANKADPVAHARALGSTATSLARAWRERKERQIESGSPIVKAGVPFVLQVEPHLDLDLIRRRIGLEIVSEQEDGYIIVASEDVDISRLQALIRGFSTGASGSAVIACVHELVEDPNQDDRLRRILSDALYRAWPALGDDVTYTVDVGVGGLGLGEIPDQPERGSTKSDEDWKARQADWANARTAAYQRWDDLKRERESEIERFVAHYGGAIISIVDGQEIRFSELPGSFTVRISMVGKGVRDLVLNYPYLFEVAEPPEFEATRNTTGSEGLASDLHPTPPEVSAPTVCVIDSGVQEGHPLLAAAIDSASSRSFLPGPDGYSVVDEVPPGGHGTRVAGAVLYGDAVPHDGRPQLRAWIQNARVLDRHCKLPNSLPPPGLMRAVIQRYHLGNRKTKVFNHSISQRVPYRVRHMSAWASEIDMLSYEYDVLVLQAAGNIPERGDAPLLGVENHLAQGRDYPAFLRAPSSRISDPAHSLQALTVGSVAYGSLAVNGWTSFAPFAGAPSPFSRTGPGIWDCIKPEVVEYGGDFLRDGNRPPNVSTPSAAVGCYPMLVRSTRFPPSPASARDAVGTSYAVPKVSRIAAEVQRVLPDEPALLYRALIVQSARWPDWAWRGSSENQAEALRVLGYGVPDLERATGNSPHRVTLVTGGAHEIAARDGHVFQVPIPASMRRPGSDYDVLVEVTLSYAAQPRRTRRLPRRYLSTWLDWRSSALGESLGSFTDRVLKDQEDDAEAVRGRTIPWVLHERDTWGVLRGVRRNVGTVQKDWAIVKSNSLPEDFCIAVVAHQGWSRDPASTAKYALAVTFEILGREIEIYDDVQVAVEALEADLVSDVEVPSD